MLPISRAVLLSLLLVSACNPFSRNESSNQFRLEKQRLFFQESLLSAWFDEPLPYCEQCLFTTYSKKMLPRAMLFRQVNNARGDLIFLAATNIRHSFVLATGSATYAVRVKKQGDRFIFTSNQKQTVVITENSKTEVALDGEKYFVYLQKNAQDAAALDLTFWLSSAKQ